MFIRRGVTRAGVYLSVLLDRKKEVFFVSRSVTRGGVNLSALLDGKK